MSRLKIIILVLVVASCIAGYIYHRNASLSTVTLDTKDSSYTLYNSVDKKTIAEVSSSTTLKLHDGTYCGVAKDSKYDSTPLCFTVFRTDTSYVFDANYSSDYLKEMAISEQPDINSIISSKYAKIIKNYTICDGSLYREGDIYGAAMVEKTASVSENNDIYRVALKKSEGEWKIINNPVIVLDKTTFSDVPLDVLKMINKIEACEPDGLLEGSSIDNQSTGSLEIIPTPKTKLLPS